MKVQTLLKETARPAQPIAGECSIEEAIELMAAEGTGALIVMDRDRPVGIFAERDVFRCLARDKTTDLSLTTLRSTVTSNLIAAEPEDDLEQIISVMLKAGVSHLPVIENQNILGMLLLTDLLRCRIDSLMAEISQLNDYIEDLHEAGRD